MNKLKESIDYYMKLKGIGKYTDLLVDIGKHLGFKKDVEIKAFIRNEKANFSKMLQGKRPLKYEFIVPLESIFGVSLSRILNEKAYLLPVEKGNIPFDKGFRYYTYIDDYDLYINEFDNKVDCQGRPIISNSDEFGKYFTDYIVEYGARNGIRYLYDIYSICFNGYFDSMISFKCKGANIYIPVNNKIAFARLAASMNDADLFFGLYNSFQMFFSNGHYGAKDSLFNSDMYQTLLLDNPLLFDKLFEIRHYEYKYYQKENWVKVEKSTFNDIPNPILNNCLDYALRRLDKYKDQAKRILEFGIEFNASIIEKYYSKRLYRPFNDELGGVLSLEEREFCSFEIVVKQENIKDKEILSLINKLPNVRVF